MSLSSLSIVPGSFKAWFFASRPRTLTVSFVPVLVAMALAKNQTEKLNYLIGFCAWFFALWVQIGTNLINDALDSKKGEELKKEVTLWRANLLSERQFLMGGLFSFFVACLFGLPLIQIGGWPLIGVVLSSLAFGYLYTGGPYPLSYLGISEGFVFLFFGWISMGSVYYLQTGKVDSFCLLAGTQIGLLAIVPHAINNLRDHLSDALVQKKTLAVRFGPTFARWEITLFSLIPFLLGYFWIQKESPLAFLLPSMVFPFVILNLRAIWEEEPGIAYHRYLAGSAGCQLFFGLLLALGLIF